MERDYEPDMAENQGPESMDEPSPAETEAQIDDELSSMYDDISDEPDGDDDGDHSQEEPGRRSSEDADDQGPDVTSLPPEFQERLQERERQMQADYTRKTQEIAEERRRLAPFVTVSDYWGGYFQQLGVQPDQAINALVQTEYQLRNGTPEQKQQALEYLRQSYGVTDGPAFDEYVLPEVKELRQQLQTIQGQMQQQRYAEQQAQHDRQMAVIGNEIDAFASQVDESGQPLFPHFDEVQAEMAHIIRSGQANSLEEAYEQALWMNPRTRETQVMQERRREANRLSQRASRARRANQSNLRGRTSAATRSHGTWEDELASAYDDAQ